MAVCITVVLITSPIIGVAPYYIVYQRGGWVPFRETTVCQFYILLLSIILCTHLAKNTEFKLCPGVCNLICLPDTWLMTLLMVMHVFLTLTLLIKEHTQTNMGGLTLVWWFTLTSLLRRNSTIWSWPFQLAIDNGVWPVCTCKGEQDRPEVMKCHTTNQLTQFNLTVTWP